MGLRRVVREQVWPVVVVVVVVVFAVGLVLLDGLVKRPHESDVLLGVVIVAALGASIWGVTPEQRRIETLRGQWGEEQQL